MALTPKNASDSLITALSEIAAVPELFFHTKKRHRPDIYECRNCGYQFPQEAKCPSCDSADMFLFMRAPVGPLPRHVTDREEWLTEQDPEWRERFCGDVDRAFDFYSDEPEPRPRTAVDCGREEPHDYCGQPGREVDHGDERDFDTDLEDQR